MRTRPFSPWSDANDDIALRDAIVDVGDIDFTIAIREHATLIEQKRYDDSHDDPHSCMGMMYRIGDYALALDTYIQQVVTHD